MPDKFLCVIATFDDATSQRMKELDDLVKESGINGKQTQNIPHHITLAYYDVTREEEIKQLVCDVSNRTNIFKLDFNHIGLFGLKVLFLAPDVNNELLELRSSFDEGNNDHGWTAHATLLIDEPDNIHKALELVADNFSHISSRVEGISLYEFFPTRLIASYKLQ